MYSFDYTLGNSQGSVRSFVSRFGTLDPDYAWFIFEQISDRVLAETPDFSNLLDGEMLLKRRVLTANLGPERGERFTTLASAWRLGPQEVWYILALVVAENRRHRSALTTAKPKTRYAVIPQRFKNWTFLRLLPVRMFDNFIAKQMGLKKP